ncbi:MAG TPA: flagellar export chaperone FlgN [Oscillospiraceae bacterium]|nr:flagellar export chaperone FlgN [Oscillospiraceae bacterium]
MINKKLSDELVLFLERYLVFYKDFLQMETEKYEDISQNKLAKLNQYVKDEQVFMLKSKGLEIERDKLVAQTGNSKTTFRELIPLFDGTVQAHLQEIYDELSNVLLDLKETNTRCNYITKLRLHGVEVNLKKLGDNPELQKIYTQKAHEGATPLNILSKRI